MSIGVKALLSVFFVTSAVILAAYLNFKMKKWIRRQGYEEALSMKHDELDLAERKISILNQRSFRHPQLKE